MNSLQVSLRRKKLSQLKISTEVDATKVTDSKSAMNLSLISRAGDLIKNNDRLKFALVGIRFPQSYDEEQ